LQIVDEVAVLPFRRHGCSCFERTELTMVAHEVELEHCGWESTQEIVTTLKQKTVWHKRFATGSYVVVEF